MNCQNIEQSLILINPNHSYSLWGLAEHYNSQYCSFNNLLSRFFEMRDFQQTLQNPIYQTYQYHPTDNIVFYPLCYGYSILRIFILICVFIYVNLKLNEIFMEIHEVSEVKNNLVRENSNLGNDSDCLHQFRTNQPQLIRISNTKYNEIKVYKYTIYFSMILSLLCALRDFILFRGLGLYSNLMDASVQLCNVNLTTDNFTCSIVDEQNNGTNGTNWQPFNYDRTECDCFYNKPSSYVDQIDGGDYMTFSIILWIVTEALTYGIASFNILTLSRINRNELSGWAFILPTIIKSILVCIATCLLFSILIYSYEMPIYYRFFNQPVIVFYFFWKMLGFIMVFDKLYSKIWMEWKLRFQSLHSHGIDWNYHMEEFKNKIIKNFARNVPKLIKNFKHKQSQDVNFLILNNQVPIKKIYEKRVNQYYNESIKPYIQKFEREANAKLKTQWYDFLNYVLATNLIGIIGFFFLIVYSCIDSQQYEFVFWIGFFFALIELVIFETSNVFFILHGFFIEIYKNIKLIEKCKLLDEEIDLQCPEILLESNQQ